MNTIAVDSDVGLPRCYDIDAVKQLTTLGRTAIYDYIAKGELKSFKFGKRTVVYEDDLKAFINAKRAAA